MSNIVVIGVDVVVQCVKPFLTALGIGSLKGNDTEWIYITHLVNINGTIHTTAYGIVLYYDIGNLKSGDIESLGWR